MEEETPLYPSKWRKLVKAKGIKKKQIRKGNQLTQQRINIIKALNKSNYEQAVTLMLQWKGRASLDYFTIICRWKITVKDEEGNTITHKVVNPDDVYTKIPEVITQMGVQGLIEVEELDF